MDIFSLSQTLWKNSFSMTISAKAAFDCISLSFFHDEYSFDSGTLQTDVISRNGTLFIFPNMFLLIKI